MRKLRLALHPSFQLSLSWCIFLRVAYNANPISPLFVHLVLLQVLSLLDNPSLLLDPKKLALTQQLFPADTIDRARKYMDALAALVHTLIQRVSRIDEVREWVTEVQSRPAMLAWWQKRRFNFSAMPLFPNMPTCFCLNQPPTHLS